MKETREVLGVWTYETGSLHAPRNSEHRQLREEWLYGYFGGKDKAPSFIWKTEFFRTIRTPRSFPEQYDYGMTLHRFARNERGSRYRTWVKVYDHEGEAQSSYPAACLEPENHRLAALPPDSLLYGWPRITTHD